MTKTDETEVKLQNEHLASRRRCESGCYGADKWSAEGAMKSCDGTFTLQKEEYVSIPSEWAFYANQGGIAGDFLSLYFYKGSFFIIQKISGGF